MSETHIPRFKAESFEAGKNSVVGDCNGHSCKERWELETPAFARAISRHITEDTYTVLDYGCGVGRLAKAVLSVNPKITILGLDPSEDERRHAKSYVNDSRFIPIHPDELNQTVDLVYCIYVLQHVPAIELRHAIERMHYFLKPGGKLVYCSSDYRMAINSGGGFTDDRHTGVDIRREISRLFEEVGELVFENVSGTEQESKLIRDLITAEGCPPGSIPHPAKVYRARTIALNTPYFGVSFPTSAPAPATNGTPAAPTHAQPKKEASTRLILQNRLSPGDILVMTAALRSLHKAYPGRFQTDVESPCSAIFENNPYITKLNGDGQKIDMHYPLISEHEAGGFKYPGSGISGRHFSDGHRKFLEEVLGLEIPRTGLLPDLFLSQDEKLWPSPVLKEHGFHGRYWALNAGSKSDVPLKQYHRYQEVVNLLKGKIQFIQIGAPEHNHPALDGVLDMRGKTNHRELYRLIFHADGVLTPVSYPMHIAAAFKKPAVVIAGGREGTRWELYPNHRFLHTNGALACCSYDGCWKAKLEDCAMPFGDVPKCMTLIKPEAVADSLMMYYEGGILQPIDKRELLHV